METIKKNWVYMSIGLVSVLLGVTALLTALRLRSLEPIAPTAPTSQQAFEGNPVTSCQVSLTGNLASPTCRLDLIGIAPSPSPSPSPSPLPSPVAICTAISVYKVTGDVTVAANWQLLTTAQLSALRPGDIIYVTTKGTVQNGGVISRGRIQVLTGTNALAAWSQSLHETVNIKPGSNPPEYYKVYSLPTGVVRFTVSAEVYSQQFDTNTNPWDANSGWR